MNQQDKSFMVTFTTVIAVLVLIGVVIFMVAQLVSTVTLKPDDGTRRLVTTQERIKPVGTVTVADASTATATAPAAPAAPAPAAAPIAAAPAPAAAPAGGGVDLAKGKSVYNSACMACHATGAAGAPKITDKAAWETRAGQGMDTLITHAVKGFKGMPAKGGNPTLLDRDVGNAVHFMLAEVGIKVEAPAAPAPAAAPVPAAAPAAVPAAAPAAAPAPAPVVTAPAPTADLAAPAAESATATAAKEAAAAAREAAAAAKQAADAAKRAAVAAESAAQKASKVAESAAEILKKLETPPVPAKPVGVGPTAPAPAPAVPAPSPAVSPPVPAPVPVPVPAPATPVPAPAPAPATPAPTQGQAAPVPGASIALPADLNLNRGKQLYNTACIACHQAGVAGAPKLTDKDAWKPRLAQGFDTLVTHVLKGFKGMPPKGGRVDLQDAEIISAVGYMVSETQ